MQIEETVFLGRNNAIKLQLAVDNVVIDHSSIIRAQVEIRNPSIGTTILDSNISPDLFDLTGTDELTLLFGQSMLAIGRYSATLVVFDTGHINGLIFGNLALNVVSG